MESLEAVKMVYFSPTGTTKRVINGIAEGISHPNTIDINMTHTSTRELKLETTENELLIVAVPVYMGRVPAVISKWLKTIKAQNTKVVCVVVYGNRTFGNSLLELTDIMTDCGCNPIAAGAFIGEHSFSNTQYPIAVSRPNSYDLDYSRTFGQSIREKLSAKSDNKIKLIVAGERPYGGVTELWDVDFIHVNSNCNKCGLCAQICPVGAIGETSSATVDTEKCIICCACIKNCPTNARTVKDGLVKDATIRLNNLCQEPKEAEYFI